MPGLGAGARADGDLRCSIDCVVVEALQTILNLGLCNPGDLEIVLDARWPPAAGKPVRSDLRGMARVIEGTDRLETIRSRACCVRTFALGNALLEFAARVRATSNHRGGPIECSRSSGTLLCLALCRCRERGFEVDP